MIALLDEWLLVDQLVEAMFRKAFAQLWLMCPFCSHLSWEAQTRVVYTLINYHMHKQLQCGLTCDCLERLLGNFTWNKKQRSRYCLIFAGWHIHISLVALYWLHLNFQMQFKLLVLTYKDIYDLIRYLQNCISRLESI